MPKPSSAPPSRLTIPDLTEYLRAQGTPLSHQAIRERIAKAGLRLDAARRVSVSEFLTAWVSAHMADNKTPREAGTGPNQDPKRAKVQLECIKLKLAIDQIKGDLVPLEEHQSALREIAQWVRDALAQWVADVKVETGNAKVVADAERLRDNVFARLREKAGEGAVP
jgi:alkylation response protein AidB-like acyl-CoA dehydrogenase